MKRRSLAILAATATLLWSAATPALAAMPTPGGGSAFGEHVATMTPDCPSEHRAMFGECVSAMAQGSTECPHSH